MVQVLIKCLELVQNKLEKIGPINPMAMEAYEEVKKRNDFITEQREDLIQAKESLKATIDEIDLAARANFMEAFEKIKDQENHHSYLQEMLVKTIQTQDAMEGMMAFRQKRTPQWKGK